ncbi:MAG: outer membrane protein assembly factor BamA [candidate division KSB1 bacterium]|nr:outer membrane protein assembly factor BamA [candidate division KSB1 bacterium]MDZ7313730.1 outer membrane protein assembly factor BamA [candidate division KSB1 bacterium]
MMHISRMVVSLFVLFCLSGGAFAQRQASLKILGISVEGNRTADANFIKLSSGLSVGEQVSSDDIQTAIKQLWSLNMFEDVAILLDRQIGDGVYLTLKVIESPRLNKIEFDGNNKLKTKDLEKELDLYKGQVISPRDLSKVRRKLKKLYEKKGYLLAEIATETRKTTEDSDRVDLRIKIHEGNKVKIKTITFHGNQAFTDGKLRKQMKKTKQDSWLRGGDFDEKKYKEDIEKFLDFYRAEGYRDVEFVRDSLYYGPEKKDMFIDIWVDEGTKYHIGNITWEGNKLYPDKLLASLLDFQTGDVYNAKKLQKAVTEKLGSLYYDAGYIFATINPIEKPVDSSTVDLHFLVTEGNAVTINKIHITGNTKTKEKVIRRELFVRPGDTFSREALIRSQREVFVLNYFSDVKPDVQPISDDKVDVLLEVAEKSTDTANMSAGWSERDKIIGSIGVAMNNLFGNGQRLSFDWNFGRYYRSFQLGFTEPWLFDTPTLAGINIFDTKRANGYGYDFAQRYQGGSVRLGRRLRWPDNYFRTDWIYRVTSTEYFDFVEELADPAYRRSRGFEEGRLTSSSITHIFSRNSLNRPEFPTAGSQISLSTELAGGPLQGNVGYHKHIFQADWFMPTFWGLVWYMNFQAGYMDRIKKDSRIPILEYFFMGGEGLTSSIALRGYEDPLRNQVGDVGRTMMKFGIELRVPIAPNPTVFGLLFAEAGNTWADLSKTDPYDLRRSVGIGARIFMPMIGIIGFDYAYGFDNLDSRTGARYGQWKPHFVFGRSF